MVLRPATLRSAPTGRVMLSRGAGWITALVLAAGLASGCGGDGTGGEAARPVTSLGDRGLAHIHAVGVDPADDAVMLATHVGLFRLAAGETAPQRVGDLRHDVMGFTIVGPNRFVGSGHPDLRTDLPSLLGLISSVDAGQKWDPVSLLGEVDFHILRANGRNIAGVDSQSSQILVSDDAGASWMRRNPPGELVDLVMHPSRSRTFIASTPVGLVGSTDAGATWKPAGDRAGYLAWPAARALYRLSAEGAVFASADAGATWTRRGDLGGTPAAFSAADANRLLVATHEGKLMESDDGGRTWSARAALA